MDQTRLQAIVRVVRAVIAVVLAVMGAISVFAGNPAGVTTDTDTVTKTQTRTIETPVPVATDPGTQLSLAQAKKDAAKSDVDPSAANSLNAVTQEDVGVGLHEDAKDETPPGVSKQQLKQGAAMTQKLASRSLVAPEQPAGAQNYRCSWHPVVNYNNLTHRIIGVALHFTVSDPGSHLGVWRLFNTPSFGASSTYLFEPLDSLCWQLIRLDKKSWAQLSANSYYWSIEIVTNDRTRAQWLATGMFKHGTLANLVADLLHRAGAPPKLVDPQGCVFLAGVTDHSRLECGNTHWDVGPNFPWDVFMRQVRQHYNGADYKPAKVITPTCSKATRGKACTPSKADQKHCERVHHWRGHGHQGGAQRRRRMGHRLAIVKSHGLKCVNGKAVRRT